jgi:hypothetical protein
MLDIDMPLQKSFSFKIRAQYVRGHIFVFVVSVQSTTYLDPNTFTFKCENCDV